MQENDDFWFFFLSISYYILFLLAYVSRLFLAFLFCFFLLFFSYLFYIFILKGHLTRLALMVISDRLYFSIVIIVSSCKCRVQIIVLLLLLLSAFPYIVFVLLCCFINCILCASCLFMPKFVDEGITTTCLRGSSYEPG